LFIGIYPQPAADWVVAATMMFSDIGASATVPDPALITAGH
jgi:hypothetical protein